MKSVVLYGAGSAIIVDVQESCRRLGYEVAAIVRNFDGEVFAMAPATLVEIDTMSKDLLSLSFQVPLFTPGYRKFAVDQAYALGVRRFDPLVDPSAIMPNSLEIGAGTYINSAVSLGAVSKLGEFVFINRAASLGHHLVVADYASIGPGVVAGGGVYIGRGSVIGVGAVLLPGVRIGSNAVVAAGSVVTRDIAEKQWDGRSHPHGIEMCQSGDANQPLEQTGASDMKVTTVGVASRMIVRPFDK